MASGAFAVEKAYEDELVFAIRDIAPRAPTHFLVIPRAHVGSAQEMEEQTHDALLGRMVRVANALAAEDGLTERGYRLTFNVGEEGGQTIYHAHLHVLGGRKLGPEG